MGNQQAGWYQDPSGDTTKLRYWNGERWTDDFADAQPSANQANGYGPTYAPTGNGQASYYQPYPTASDENDRTLRLIAFVFCIISTVAAGCFIIPLAWMIPMTVHSWGIYKGTKPNTTAFGVCTLIFVSLVSGILLLVSKKEA